MCDALMQKNNTHSCNTSKMLKTVHYDFNPVLS